MKTMMKSFKLCYSASTKYTLYLVQKRFLASKLNSATCSHSRKLLDTSKFMPCFSEVACPSRKSDGSLISAYNISQFVLHRSCHTTSTLLQNQPSCKEDSVSETAPSAEVSMNLRHPDGSETAVACKPGQTLLDVVIENNVDIDGFGACDGTLSCSSCHLIFSEELYEATKQSITDEELDMLDLGFDITDTSRLGCQCVVDGRYNKCTLKIPNSINDAR